MTQIKICGLSRECDIDYVNRSGPDYAGFILRYSKSRRNVSVQRAAALRARLAPGIRAVGVTSPWVFGIEVEDEYARAVSEAVVGYLKTGMFPPDLELGSVWKTGETF